MCIEDRALLALSLGSSNYMYSSRAYRQTCLSSKGRHLVKGTTLELMLALAGSEFFWCPRAIKPSLSIFTSCQ